MATLSNSLQSTKLLNKNHVMCTLLPMHCNEWKAILSNMNDVECVSKHVHILGSNVWVGIMYVPQCVWAWQINIFDFVCFTHRKDTSGLFDFEGVQKHFCWIYDVMSFITSLHATHKQHSFDATRYIQCEFNTIFNWWWWDGIKKVLI